MRCRTSTSWRTASMPGWATTGAASRWRWPWAACWRTLRAACPKRRCRCRSCRSHRCRCTRSSRRTRRWLWPAIAGTTALVESSKGHFPMRKHLQGIDHVVIAVGDMARAAANFGRFGFTLTPRGRHTTGSVNHCIMFERDYFELLSVPVAHPVTRYYQEFLAQGDGLAALALATDDARGFHDELAADGIPADAPVDFSRPVQLADRVADAAFRITQIAPDATPAGRVFACQHFTREVVWRPEYQQHANRVLGLARIIAAADPAHLQAVAQRYASIFAVAARSGTIGAAPCFDVDTGYTPLSLTTAAGLAQLLPGLGKVTRPQPCFAALYFRSASVAAVREVLHANAVPCIELSPQAVAVAPEHGHGVA